MIRYGIRFRKVLAPMHYRDTSGRYYATGRFICLFVFSRGICTPLGFLVFDMRYDGLQNRIAPGVCRTCTHRIASEFFLRTGYVTHGSDRSLWAFRTPILEHEQIQIARVWLSRVSSELQEIETEGNPLRSEKEILALDEDTKIRWVEDPRWEEKMRLFVALSGK